MKHPDWARQFASEWRAPTRPSQHAVRLREGIARLAQARVGEPEHALPDQPFDRHLLAASPLFRASRGAYLAAGGEFRATLVSSPRTLSSPILLEPEIEYSPIERELFWAATDPHESKRDEHLLTLRTYVASLYHEQNHRVLWKHLPPAPSSFEETCRYLNLAESVIVALDMALGDELGPELAGFFYLSGATYDPGTSVRREIEKSLPRAKAARAYRNYLHAALHATYLNLELFDPREIPGVIRALYENLGPELADRASRRALNLDRAFVERTNPTWQKKHAREVSRKLKRAGEPALRLKDSPVQDPIAYLQAERAFERMGL